MCGICGINWNDKALVGRMTDQLAHRGPDQSGVYASELGSLGHRRLSIIDLSEHGRQPLSNEDDTIQVVFNGEIYNFAEIRQDLEAKGHRFKGHSDTEVIVHGYEAYGTDIVHQFRGIFAFTLLDLRNQLLWLVRDRLGVKPLYYHWGNGRLLFASEIKAMLECPDVGQEVNDQAIYDYIGFEFVPAPSTMFKGVHKLAAGHQLILKQGGEPQISQYWEVPFVEPDAMVTDETECVEQIRHLIDESVRYRLIADVPLAAFLSGGLDSSTIVAMMRRHVSGRLRTFTIGYHDKTFSELDYAQKVAEQFDTDHEVLMIDGMTPERIEKSLWHFDEPMTDLSSIPLMLICEQARQQVTVCLSGEGGDEVFAGYDRFKASRLNRFYSLIPSVLRRSLIQPAILNLADRPQKKGAVNMLKRFVQGSMLPADAAHLRWQYFLTPGQDRSLFSDDFLDGLNPDPFYRLKEVAARYPGADAINHETFLDLAYEMPDSVLMKADRMSMACGLELRVPLLDHQLVEYMARVPGSWKLKGFETKHIFRKALEGILPHEIAYRGKQGYSLPVKNLLRDELRSYMTELLNESAIVKRITRPDTVNRLIEEHVAARHNHNHVLWGLIHVAIWHRRFFEQERKPHVSQSASEYKVKSVDGSGGAWQKYRSVMYGDQSLSRVIYSELVMLLCGSLPGALGLVLRRILFPRLFGACGKKTVFGRNLTLRHAHKIRLGAGVIIDDDVVLDAKGTDNHGIDVADGVYVGRHSIIYCKNGDIQLAKQVNVSSNCQIYSSHSLLIGEGTVIGAYSYFLSGGSYDMHSALPFAQQDGMETKGPLRIGSNCWLGARVTVLDAASIGNDCVVAAGAVVNKPVAASLLVAGVPAKTIRTIEKNKIKENTQ